MVCLSRENGAVVPAPPSVLRGSDRMREGLESPSFAERVLGGRTKGIFRVTGRISRKGKGLTGVRIKMVHNLANKTVVIPKRPWLRPAVDKARKQMPAIYRKALKQQLIRHRLFTGK